MQLARAQSIVYGDRFRAEREGAAGGMATVFRAIDLHTGEPVALKVLQEKQSLDRFHQEAALLAELSHPAIVRYIGHGTTPGGEHYIAMEWLDGETLEDRLGRGRLGVLETARLGRRVLEALAVAHRRGVVHRDIKPANIFLPGGDLAQAKVLDFGIARRAYDARRLTSTGSTLGTPAYMSPEQARGLPTVDARSDIFSMGSVLFECVAGRPAFEGSTPVAVLAKICVDQPVEVSARCPGLPVRLAGILERMLAKKADRRPDSAAALAQELAASTAELRALGFEEELPGGRERTPAPVVIEGEQRVLSAILVSPPRPSNTRESPAFRTWDLGQTQIRRVGVVDLVDPSGLAELEEAMRAFGATVERLVDGSLLVTMTGEGTPTDQAVHAARCALKIKSLVPRATLAVSTGRLVVGGRAALSEVIDGAARLLKGERPGTVWLDGVTAGLLEARFQIEGSETKKRLLFEKGPREAPRTVMGKEVPCVGRDRELGTLEALYDECVNEPVARVVLVTSPAGGGKSRVQHELLERIRNRGHAFEFLIGRGDPIRAGAPLGLLAQAVRGAAGITGGEREEVQRKRLAAHVGRRVSAEIAQRVTVFLGEMAGVKFPDDDNPALKAARQDARLMADQMLAAWLDWIEAECSADPVVLVLEDLHWGDVPSVQFVDAALRTLKEKPLLVVALARPEVDEKFPGLWVERDVQRMPLAPLGAKAAGKLVRAVLGDLPPEKAAWIIERADGNPFYLEELLRGVSNGMEVGEGASVPQTVLGMVQARFDALGADAKKVLRAASVFGQTFRAGGVRALVSGRDEDRTIDDWLEILAAKEVVFARAAGETREFVFRHALVRDAAYDMIPDGDRPAGHKLAGEYLEKAGERDANVLVEHFERGGELPKAAYWSRFAAEQALEANDLEAVIRRVERGVKCGAEGEVLGYLKVAEAEARFWRGECGEAERASRGAVGILRGHARTRAIGELVNALGQQGKLSEVAVIAKELPLNELRPTDAQTDLASRAAMWLCAAGRISDVEALVASFARNTSNTIAAARFKEVLSALATCRGQRDHAVYHLREALGLLQEVGNERMACAVAVNLNVLISELGQFDESVRGLLTLKAKAGRIGLPHVVVGALVNLALIYRQLSRYADGWACADEARGRIADAQDKQFLGGIYTYLAQNSYGLGEYARARSESELACRELAGDPSTLPEAQATLARVLVSLGDTRGGVEIASEAYERMQHIPGVQAEAFVQLAYFEALFAAGRLAEAHAIARGAAQILRERAASFADISWSETFLRAVPEHAAILRAADLPGQRD